MTKDDVEKIMDWENSAPKLVEIPFKPARVLLQVCCELIVYRIIPKPYWMFVGSEHVFNN